eukprot:4101341-Prymnesium_polylepis.1
MSATTRQPPRHSRQSSPIVGADTAQDHRGRILQARRPAHRELRRCPARADGRAQRRHRDPVPRAANRREHRPRRYAGRPARPHPRGGRLARNLAEAAQPE